MGTSVFTESETHHDIDVRVPSPPESDHPSDTETDIAVLREVPPQFEVADEQSANWLIRKVMEARAYADRTRAFADRELARAAREERTLMTLFGRQLERWAKAEVDKLKGRRRSINLPAGTVGFRKVGSKLVIDSEQVVMRWAEDNAPGAVVTVKKLLKSVLDDHLRLTGEMPAEGAHDLTPPASLIG